MIHSYFLLVEDATVVVHFNNLIPLRDLFCPSTTEIKLKLFCNRRSVVQTVLASGPICGVMTIF
jgi:hypothetical protein